MQRQYRHRLAKATTKYQPVIDKMHGENSGSYVEVNGCMRLISPL